MQQERDVAGEFDEDVNHAVDQPVAGEPQDAHDEAQNRRQHDAAGGNKQGVEDANDGGPEVRVPRVVIDEGREGDVVGGRREQEVETETLAEGRKIDGHIADDQGKNRKDNRQRHDLDDDRAGFFVAPEPCDQVT